MELRADREVARDVDVGDDSYLDRLASAIRREVPSHRLPEEDTRDLFRIYAVLLLAVGANVRPEDVHNAWVAWMASRNGSHEALVPYVELDRATASEDDVYVTAIRIVARSEDAHD